MKINATSGSFFSLYLSVILIVILVSISDEAHAKRGCSSFGHSCFGAHGKRFDSTAPHNTLEKKPSSILEYEVSPSTKELIYVIPNEFREQSDQFFIRTRKNIQPLGVYPLSSLVDRWIASQRRMQRRIDTNVTK